MTNGWKNAKLSQLKKRKSVKSGVGKLFRKKKKTNPAKKKRESTLGTTGRGLRKNKNVSEIKKVRQNGLWGGGEAKPVNRAANAGGKG